MFKVNDNYLKLPGSYLFSTIAKKVNAFTAANPQAEIIRLGIGDVTKQLMSRPQQRDSKVMHRILAMHFCVRRSQRMIMKLTDVTSQQMRFLYPTVQRAILQIFRRFSLWTIKLRYVIRFTRFMWIPTLWQAEPALTIRKVRPGVM